jgi:uncharacterized protein with PIN domain
VFILSSDTTYLVFIYIVNLIISIAVFYIIVLITIKQFKLLTLKSEKGKYICPKCNKTLERIERESKDKALNYLTLFLLEWKRYSCFNCGWQGSSSWMYRFKK